MDGRGGARGRPENAYDVLGKALMPIAAVFTGGGSDATRGTPRCLVLDARLVAANKLPPALQGEPVHVALRTPDALLVQAPSRDRC